MQLKQPGLFSYCALASYYCVLATLPRVPDPRVNHQSTNVQIAIRFQQVKPRPSLVGRSVVEISR